MINNLKPGFKIKLKQYFAKRWDLAPNKFFTVIKVKKSFSETMYYIDASPRYLGKFTAFSSRVEQVKGYFSDG